jgi:hypothetical protein
MEKAMSEGFTGGCLCGKVRYSSTMPPQLTGHCHCVDCRRTSGTGHATHVVIAEPTYSASGEIRFYDRPADSGNVVRRGFCPDCGSAIHSTNSGMPGMIFVRASSLDDPEVAMPSMAVYASRAPSWDHIDRNLPRFATMPEGGPGAVLET